MPYTKADCTELFKKHFQSTPDWVARAPGRVNLIGEHTDYNEGFVFPLAIDRAVWIAGRARNDNKVLVNSADYNAIGEFSLDDVDSPPLAGTEMTWLDYIKGVAWSLSQAGYPLAGWEGVLIGDVPLGAGLSSSAALELATARAFFAVAHFRWDPVKMALLAQNAENNWVGMNCGIMDQLISSAGVEGQALLIDCRSLECTPVPMPRGVAVVVLDTATRRGLVDSAYNERRAQCEAVAKQFGVEMLRDVSCEEFQKKADSLDPIARKRAKHVIFENQRTLMAADAMRANDPKLLGELFYASHVSLRDDFEVTNDALNAIVEAAQAHPACYGARMTGAGFGGCAVALVEQDQTDDFVKRVAADYKAQTGNTPAIYVCNATNGAELC